MIGRLVEAVRRWRCRSVHGGFYFEAYRCTRCGTMFPDARASGLLDEFNGFVVLDEHRVLDEEAARHREWRMQGYRVVIGGAVIEVEDDDAVASADGKRRRVMGGVEIDEWERQQREKEKRGPARARVSDRLHPRPHAWGDAPEPKRAKPIAVLPIRKGER